MLMGQRKNTNRPVRWHEAGIDEKCKETFMGEMDIFHLASQAQRSWRSETVYTMAGDGLFAQAAFCTKTWRKQRKEVMLVPERQTLRCGNGKGYHCTNVCFSNKRNGTALGFSRAVAWADLPSTPVSMWADSHRGSRQRSPRLLHCPDAGDSDQADRNGNKWNI